MKRKRTLARLASATALAAVAINIQAPTVDAADHVDGPATTADAAADIGDVFAWHTDDSIVVVVTFAGLLALDQYPVYDEGVLYTVHLDTTADEAEVADWQANGNDNESDIDIQIRLGSNLLEEAFIQVTDLPGTDDVLVGRVEEQVGEDTARAYLGTFDDPFFFDFDGFVATATNLVDDADAADLAFAGLAGAPADAFEGSNTMAIVIEFPIADVLPEADMDGQDFVQIWASTGRVP